MILSEAAAAAESKDPESFFWTIPLQGILTLRFSGWFVLSPVFATATTMKCLFNIFVGVAFQEFFDSAAAAASLRMTIELEEGW